MVQEIPRRVAASSERVKSSCDDSSRIQMTNDFLNLIMSLPNFPELICSSGLERFKNTWNFRVFSP